MFKELGVDESWKEHWQDMPEFNMTPEIPVLTIKLNFKSQEDIKKFSELFGQEIKFSQENYWFPKLNRCAVSELIYIQDES